jgi:hypothetical protein
MFPACFLRDEAEDGLPMQVNGMRMRVGTATMKAREQRRIMIRRTLASLIWLTGSLAWGSDLVSDFSTGNEGWMVADVNFAGTNGFPTTGSITNMDPNPPVDSGRLKVVDVGTQWTWAIAPARFQGDWRRKASVQADITAASSLAIKYQVLFWLSDSRNSDGTNAAYHVFPLAMTANGTTNTYFASLSPTNWVVTRGSWSNLLQNVREFWARLDLTDGCSTCGTPEIDWLDNVAVKQGWLSPLQVALRNTTVVLDWSGDPATRLQKCGSLGGPGWQLIPGTAGVSHYEEPATSNAVFYRLIQ